MNTSKNKFFDSRQKSLISEKRGLAHENIIFLILNTVFFVVLFIFIVANAEGRPVYEQAYAKQIALLIDEAKPDMTISLNMQDVVEKYEKPITEIVEIDNEEKRVIVKLGKSGGQSFRYFTDAKISTKFQEKYSLVIMVEEK